MPQADGANRGKRLARLGRRLAPLVEARQRRWRGDPVQPLSGAGTFRPDRGGFAILTVRAAKILWTKARLWFMVRMP